MAGETVDKMVSSTVARMVEKLGIYWVAVKGYLLALLTSSTLARMTVAHLALTLALSKAVSRAGIMVGPKAV